MTVGKRIGFRNSKHSRLAIPGYAVLKVKIAYTVSSSFSLDGSKILGSNVRIDWGDGTSSELSPGQMSHRYEVSGGGSHTYYVRILGDVTSIEGEAFRDERIRSVLFNSYALIDLSSLTIAASLISDEISFGSNVDAIPANLLYDKAFPRKVVVESSRFSLNQRVDIQFGTTGMLASNSGLEELAVRRIDTDGIIGKEFAANCTKLKTLYLCEGTRTIGAHAFYRCAMRKVCLPSSVSAIGRYAFAWNLSLEEFDCSRCAIATLTEYTLSDCGSLKCVRLPASLTSIERGSLPAVTDHPSAVYVRSATPPTWNSCVADFVGNADSRIYVPAASVSAYKSASGWSDVSGKIEGSDVCD